MKRGHWPKNGTVETSPGRVRDMSRTSATKKIMPGYIFGVYSQNTFGLSGAFRPSYKGLEVNKRSGFGGFIRDIFIGLAFTSTRQVNI